MLQNMMVVDERSWTLEAFVLLVMEGWICGEVLSLNLLIGFGQCIHVFRLVSKMNKFSHNFAYLIAYYIKFFC